MFGFISQTERKIARILISVLFYIKRGYIQIPHLNVLGSNRVKSVIFGQTAKFGQRPCLFHISNIGIKNKLTKQTVKILTAHLNLHCLQSVCPNLPDVRIYSTLP